jgi:nicotinamide-nucleotide amidase
MEYTQASIITIGDELLIGQVIDTNSAWMAQQLNKVGIRVARRVAVGDVWQEIWNALDEESKHADIILITGGLGPTADDITKPLLCKYFNGNMIMDQHTLQHVTQIFEKILKRPMIESNIKQAEVPDCCTVIPNKNGTAPGMWFAKKMHENSVEKIFVSMPGVPFEMKGMMLESVIPKLLQQFTFPYIVHRTLLTAGIGESFLAAKLKEFETTLPTTIKLAYLPNYGLVRLRLTGTSTNKVAIETAVQQLFEQLQFLVHEHIVIAEDATMQQVIAKMLITKKQTLCTAESCTGGYIAHLLTEQAGASAYYNGSVVSYSYQAKEDILQVEKNTLTTKGAVCEDVVIQMAKGALTHFKTDYSIAVSGIMGPDGGTEDKPVGTVWIAVANSNNVVTQKFNFRFERSRNIDLTAVNALNMLRLFIIDTDNIKQLA